MVQVYTIMRIKRCLLNEKIDKILCQIKFSEATNLFSEKHITFIIIFTIKIIGIKQSNLFNNN